MTGYIEHSPIEAGIFKIGKPSLFTCPECHGSLLEIVSDGLTRFRCHTGHAYSLQTLIKSINETIEESLWDSVRTIDEQMLLLRRLGDQSYELGDTLTAEQFYKKSGIANQYSDNIRKIIFKLQDSDL